MAKFWIKIDAINRKQFSRLFNQSKKIRTLRFNPQICSFKITMTAFNTMKIIALLEKIEVFSISINHQFANPIIFFEKFDTFMNLLQTLLKELSIYFQLGQDGIRRAFINRRVAQLSMHSSNFLSKKHKISFIADLIFVYLKI